LSEGQLFPLPKGSFLTLITTCGLEKNQYAGALVQHEVDVDELFA
jgi:hypothetical protein